MIKIGYPIGSQYNTNMRWFLKTILNHSDAQLTCHIDCSCTEQLRCSPVVQSTNRVYHFADLSLCHSYS